ncbi:MAG TPA: preprotein translocase subunit SecG [Candidatus Eisenbacteria bacterium]|nr:preprotein translocase subunit SecG [Candidatus Eisenbacteria bacterium]
MPGFLIAIFTVIHLIACLALMISILLQSGKGGGLAGAFGGGSSQTLFGGRGAASFLSRASTVLAIVFFVTSLTLGLSASRNSSGRSSLIQEEARRRAAQRTGTAGQPQGAPATGQPAGQAPAADIPTGQAPAGTSPAPNTTAPATGAPTTGTPATPPPSGGK